MSSRLKDDPDNELAPTDNSFLKLLGRAQKIQREYLGRVAIHIEALATPKSHRGKNESFNCVVFYPGNKNECFFFYKFWTAKQNNDELKEFKKAVKEAAKQ